MSPENALGRSSLEGVLNGTPACWVFSQPFFPVLSRVGEPSAPKLEARFHNRGNSFKVNWIKQDDGGLPIKHYLVRYKAVSTRGGL